MKLLENLDYKETPLDFLNLNLLETMIDHYAFPRAC